MYVLYTQKTKHYKLGRILNGPWLWYQYSTVSQPFLVRSTLTKSYSYLAAPLDGKIGLMIKEEL